MHRQKPLTFIDLFCGCGGFTLGLQKAGFRCLAAVDFNAEAVATLRANATLHQIPHVLHQDLTAFGPEKLAALIGTDRLDVIVGGPPCQGFSTVRQVDGANHGSRVKRDKRRYLYRSYLEYVRHFKPSVFVMENVLGMQSAAKGRFFTRVQHEARLLGYRVHGQVEESWKLGVPQKRRRQLIIGVRADVPGFFPSELHPPPAAFAQGKATGAPKLWDAIGDLPPLQAGEGEEFCAYDTAKRREFLKARGEAAHNYLHNVLEVDRADRLTAHRSRPHSSRDLRDFARLREGEHGGEAIARGEKMEFPYKRTCFTDRFKRQHREELCSTIVAHLSKDGLMFVHPTQNRSLTPREAARVQSFPDWFVFPVARTHQFRLIGNAVPPLVAEAVGHEIAKLLVGASKEITPSVDAAFEIPVTVAQAKEWLSMLMELRMPDLQALDRRSFLNGWYALLWMFPELHPNNALDHGDEFADMILGDLDTAAFQKRYARSGWPVSLVLIGKEAWRRHKLGQLSKDELFCAAVQRAGVMRRGHGLKSTKNLSS